MSREGRGFALFAAAWSARLFHTAASWRDLVSDANVVVEVMSKGTARRDREDKWAAYQTLPRLEHYMLVTHDRPHVESIDRLNGE